MIQNLPCPSCGAPVTFRSAISVYAVCPFCKSTLTRSGVNVEKIGAMAELPPDMSPIMVGTTGEYRGVHFGVIGRAKIGWEHGVWNEWCLMFDDGRTGWLAEAQGDWAVSFEREKALAAQTAERVMGAVMAFEKGGADGYVDYLASKEGGSRLSIGDTVTIDKTTYALTDVKAATFLGSEGELPYQAPAGLRTLTFDLTGEEGEFATIEAHNGLLVAYVGEYVPWDTLKCFPLRPLEGWWS